MLSRVLQTARQVALPVGTVAVAVAGGGYLYDRLANANMNKMDETIRWDDDWDRYVTVPKERYDEVKDWFVSPEREIVDERILFDKQNQIGIRQVILVRSGTTEGGTILEEEQAKLSGSRLKEVVPGNVRKIFYAPSSKKTATTIASFFPNAVLQESALLNEAVPAKPDPHHPHCPPYVAAEGQRLEKGFRTFFSRPEMASGNVSIDIIIGPGNCLRYFVCRAMQLDPRFWLRFALHNCSHTTIVLNNSGTVTVPNIGDTGHLASSKITYH